MKKNICLVCGHKMTIWQPNLFDDRYGAPGKYNVYKCQSCGFARLNPWLSTKQISKFYAKYYPLSQIEPKQVLKSANPVISWMDWFNGVDNIAHKYIKKNSTVLDIGSASGQSLLEIKRLGGQAFGVEPDPNSQRLAKKLNLLVWSGVLSKQVFPKKKFDFITASQVIEHEENPDKFLKIAKSKLSNEGQIILAFPNANSFYRIIFGRLWVNWHVPYHCNFFSEKSFKILADNNDLTITKIRTITPTIWTIQQLRSVASRASESHPNPIWKVEKAKKAIQGSQDVNLIAKILNLVSIPIAVFNRIVDWFGMGDSFLVFLENKYD